VGKKQKKKRRGVSGLSMIGDCWGQSERFVAKENALLKKKKGVIQSEGGASSFTDGGASIQGLRKG